jgi:hypothetical protein
VIAPVIAAGDPAGAGFVRRAGGGGGRERGQRRGLRGSGRRHAVRNGDGLPLSNDTNEETNMKKLINAVIAMLIATAGGTAAAETSGVAASLKEAPVLPTGWAVRAGGGVSGHTSSEARDQLGTGAYWEARVQFGSRSYLGAELAYVGTGREVAALGLEDNALLVSNGIEQNGRLQLPMQVGALRLQPFIFSGIGYARLQVTNSTWNGSIVKNEANALTMPMGAGFGTTYGHFNAELRFTYRRVIDDDMIKAPGSDSVNLNNWNAGLTIGYEI